MRARVRRIGIGCAIGLGLALGWMAGSPADAVGESDARALLERAAAALHPGATMSGRALLFTRDAEGEETTLVFDWLRRSREGERAVVLEVRQPEHMEGTVHQLVFQDGRSIARRVWSPVRGRLDRMRGDRPTDPFLGSFFTYEDLGWVAMAAGTTAEVRRFEESGRRRVAVRTGAYELYDSVEVVIDEATGLPVRASFRDRAAFLFRRLTFTDVREVDGHAMPMRIEAEDLLSGVRSRLEFDGLRFDVRADPFLFEPDFGGRPLRRGQRIDVPVDGDGEPTP